MKAQVIILTLFLALLSLNSFAKANGSQDNEPKNVVKNKYDFNLFRFYAIDLKQHRADSIILKETLIEVKRKLN